MDVMTAEEDQSHDLILYNWQNSSNQLFKFKRFKGNFYYIVSNQYHEYMRKSNKITQWY